MFGRKKKCPYQSEFGERRRMKIRKRLMEGKERNTGQKRGEEGEQRPDHQDDFQNLPFVSYIRSARSNP